MRAYQPQELFTKYPIEQGISQIIQFPLVRLILKLGLMLIAMALFSFVWSKFSELINLSSLIGAKLNQICISIVQVIGAILGLIFYTRFVERRSLIELNFRAFFKEFGIGFGIGVVLISLVVACMYFSGVLQFTAFNGYHNMFNFFGAWITAAFIEEFIFRGIIFKLTEEALGTFIALVIQAALFGFVHFSNPNAGLLPALAISIEAGILLAAIYLLTRRLWMAIGMHFSWNWMQGSIYDIQVSGHELQGVFESSVSGSAFLSGGDFGAEASIFAIIICTFTGIVLLIKALKMPNNIVQPIWKRNKTINEY